MSAPPPPYSCGKRNPHQPELAHLGDDLVGEATSSDPAPRPPARPLAGAKSRTVSRSSLCSSLSSKFTAEPMRLASRVPMGVDAEGASAGRHLDDPRRLQLQALDLQQLLDRVAAVLAAVARLLVAAERGERVEGAAVDLDLAGADALGDADRAVLVGRPDAAGEAVVGVVGDPDRVLLVRRRAGSRAPGRRSPPGRSSSPVVTSEKTVGRTK